jgi:hypothetical protein
LLSACGLHPILIWGMDFYEKKPVDESKIAKNREASRRSMERARMRRRDALLQKGYSSKSITNQGHLRKPSSPTLDDQS